MINAEILILTAGKSLRMGQPKALLSINGKPLINYQIDRLRGLNLPITLVLGAYAEEITQVTRSKGVQLVINQHFEKGMSASIATGVDAIQRGRRGINAIIVCAVDQPKVPVGHFKKLLLTAQETHCSIIQSSSEQQWTGIPTLFKEVHFDALTKLSGDQGAKSIIQQNQTSVKSVMAPFESLIDIDTFEQYENLKLD